MAVREPPCTWIAGGTRDRGPALAVTRNRQIGSSNRQGTREARAQVRTRSADEPGSWNVILRVPRVKSSPPAKMPIPRPEATLRIPCAYRSNHGADSLANFLLSLFPGLMKRRLEKSGEQFPILFRGQTAFRDR